MMEWVKNYPRSAELCRNHNRKEMLQALDFLDISDDEKEIYRRSIP